jgi:Sporulation protein Cse60
MTQVKLFASTEDIAHIEVKINEWLKSQKDITIVDIKFAMTARSNASIYTIYTVIYKENSNGKY